MSLLPQNQTDLLDAYLAEEQAAEATPAPSLTYRLNFDNGRVGGLVDELDAIKQFVRKALVTCRSRHWIYSDDYGCELDELIGSDVTEAFLQAEIPRMVREALIYDDRIEDVTDITVSRLGDAVHVSATVVSVYGDFTQEVTL